MDRVDRPRRLPSWGSLLRYQRRVIVGSIGVALILGLVYVFVMPSTYTAQSSVLLSPAPGNPLTAEAASSSAIQMTVALETEAQVMRTPGVADAISDELGRTTPDGDEQLEVSVPSNTQILEIDFTAATPERAQAGANAFAEGYLDYRAERSRAVQEARIARLNEQVAATDDALRAAITSAQAAGSSVYESQQVQLLADRLAQLSNSLSAEQSIGTDPGSVVTTAQAPSSSNELPAWVMLVAAALGGAVIGIGIGMLREWRRDLLRESDDGTDLGVPVFARILTPPSTLVDETAGEVRESYRLLRTAVIANGKQPFVLAVTGADDALSTEIATNLAIVLAEARFRVALVPGIPEAPTVERLLGVRQVPGLADTILDGHSVAGALEQSHGVFVLPSGRGGHDVHDLTSTAGFRAVVSTLRAEFDFVILAAGSPSRAEGESTILTADATLLVVTPGATTRSVLEITLERLESLGVSVIGAVNAGRSEPLLDASVPAGGATADQGVADEAPKLPPLDEEEPREGEPIVQPASDDDLADEETVEGWDAETVADDTDEFDRDPDASGSTNSSMKTHPNPRIKIHEPSGD